VNAGERTQLLRELRAIQVEVPEVEVIIDWAQEVSAAQNRVNEIQRMLNADIAQRTPKADLGER
jgi:stage III sporulation protein SpoIIIAA